MLRAGWWALRRKRWGLTYVHRVGEWLHLPFLGPLWWLSPLGTRGQWQRPGAGATVRSGFGPHPEALDAGFAEKHAQGSCFPSWLLGPPLHGRRTSFTWFYILAVAPSAPVFPEPVRARVSGLALRSCHRRRTCWERQGCQRGNDNLLRLPLTPRPQLFLLSPSVSDSPLEGSHSSWEKRASGGLLWH